MEEFGRLHDADEILWWYLIWSAALLTNSSWIHGGEPPCALSAMGGYVQV